MSAEPTWKNDAKEKLKSYVGQMVALEELAFYVVVTPEFKKQQLFKFFDYFATAKNVERMGCNL